LTDKRTQLKKVAADAVQRSGIQNLSFRTLADHVGVKSSSVHYYFPEKADLATSLIESYPNDFVEMLDAIDKKQMSLEDTLDAFVNIFRDVLKADKLCLCGMMAAEIAVLNDANKGLLSQYFTILENWLSKHFDNNKHQLIGDFQSSELARMVLSGLEGAILLDRVEGSQNRLNAQHDLIKVLISKV